MSFDGGTTDETPTRTRFEPPTSRAARPFWEASREQRLVLQWCRSCDEPIHYPRDACPQCLGDDLEFRPSAGTGEVYAALAAANWGGRWEVVPPEVDAGELANRLS